MDSSAWTGGAACDPMKATTDNFDGIIDLDNFDNFDLDFTDFTNATDHHHGVPHQLNDLSDSLNVPHLQNPFSLSHSPQQGHDATAQVSQQRQDASNRANLSQPGSGFFPFNMPDFSQSGQQHFSAPQEQTFRHNSTVPPTPNSIEMHADAAQYLEQMARNGAMFGQQYQMRKDDAVAFTPLDSPAMTPHETRLHFPEHTTVPGAYFSPLTSPALEAQNNHQQMQYQMGQFNPSGTPTDAFAVDINMEMVQTSPMAQPDASRKLRNGKKSTQRSSNRVRQSPIVKPNTRRKSTLSAVIPSMEVREIMEEAQKSANSSQSPSGGFPATHSREDSRTESISPEALSEMGPPPKPGSTATSPALVASNDTAHSAPNLPSDKVCPATPASLMRLQTSPHFITPQHIPPLLEDLELPEAADVDPQPVLSNAELTAHDGDANTPRASVRGTPNLRPLRTQPSAPPSVYGNPSPSLSAINSPTSPAFKAGKNNKTTDAKTSRTSKKRTNTSMMVSPAIRPKISPSIKPLLPDGAVINDTHAQLLASKSNYQNIVDGTTVPGVTYPSSLSTNLTSKRTSHKLAEQGRRNRINTALMELQSLIPSPMIAAKDAKSPDSSGSNNNGNGGSGGGAGSAAQQNNSKATKVEGAIQYIKLLQKEMSRKDEEVESLRRELERLRGQVGSPEVKGKTPPVGLEKEREGGGKGDEGEKEGGKGKEREEGGKEQVEERGEKEDGKIEVKKKDGAVVDDT